MKRFSAAPPGIALTMASAIVAIFAHSASAQPYRLDSVAVSRGGGSTTSTQPAYQKGFIVVGQSVIGSAASTSPAYKMDLGLVPITERPVAKVFRDITWVASPVPPERLWDTSSNWSPTDVPNNGLLTYDRVTIGNAGSEFTCRLSAVSPRIARLTLVPAYALLVNQASLNSLSLSFDAPLFEPASTSGAGSVIRVSSNNSTSRTFTINDMVLDQDPTAELQATATGSGTVILRLTECTVTGGIVRTTGSNASVRLLNSRLVDCQVFGAVTDPSQTSTLQGTVNNQTTITIAGTAGQPSALIANSTTTLSGPGRILLTDESGSTLGAAGTTFSNSATHLIEGAGTIRGGLINGGIVRSNMANKKLLMTGFDGTTNNATLVATTQSAGQYATLEIENTITGSGQLIADPGGIVRLKTGAAVSNQSVTVHADGRFEMEGSASAVIAGNLSTLAVLARGDTPPVVSSRFQSALNVQANIDLAPSTTVIFQSTVPLQLGGNFINACNNNMTFDADAAQVVLNGPSPPSTEQRFEVAGCDLGPAAPAGFIDNFAFQSIQIDPGRIARFVNDVPNRYPTTQTAEALYVQNLSLQANATAIIDRCRVYAATRTLGIGTSIVVANGGALISTHVGDLDNSGGVSPADVATFGSVLRGLDSDPDHRFRADANGDGRVDGRDVQAFVTLLVAPPSPPTCP